MLSEEYDQRSQSRKRNLGYTYARTLPKGRSTLSLSLSLRLFTSCEPGSWITIHDAASRVQGGCTGEADPCKNSVVRFKTFESHEGQALAADYCRFSPSVVRPSGTVLGILHRICGWRLFSLNRTLGLDPFRVPRSVVTGTGPCSSSKTVQLFTEYLGPFISEYIIINGARGGIGIRKVLRNQHVKWRSRKGARNILI